MNVSTGDSSVSGAAETKEEILHLKHLPALSVTATRLLQLVADPDVEVDDLAHIIEQDPAVSARLLSMANSAYFGQAEPIQSIQTAIVRVLGLNLVKSLALGVVLSDTFDTQRCPGFDTRNYWCRSLGSAVLARRLAALRPDMTASIIDRVYLAGLLRDIGQMLLAHLRPDDYSAALNRIAEEPDQNRAAVEQQIVGVDSHEAGLWLAKSWKLPECVLIGMGEMPDPMLQEHRQILEAVDQANEAVGGLLLAGKDNVEQVIESMALNGPVADAVSSFANELEQICVMAEAL